MGVDPEAPDAPGYHRVKLEKEELPQALGAVIACTSLHHVADPSHVLSKMASALSGDGVVIVVEWRWEDFDESTARWCFDRLGPPEPAGWLHRRRDEWSGSLQTWGDYLRGWAAQEGLHTGASLLRELDRRFDRRMFKYGPYFFPELAHTTESDEQAAIDRGEIQACRIHYVGQLPVTT